MKGYIQRIQSMFKKGTLNISEYQKGQLSEVINEAFPARSLLDPSVLSMGIKAFERPVKKEKKENKIENPFVKSFNSVKEIGEDIWDGITKRNNDFNQWGFFTDC
ncbi:hypothetical protein [Peribacillus loiseleuriae]|uniref:hypothetical protein n=1 Tax=Peribacillus loiseleuriae TaxID=1679170 RepID=UPI003D090DA8